MPWRAYTITQKYTKRDGTVSTYKVLNRKWINSKKPYKSQKRGFEKKLIYSKRFGFLDLYNRKEQQILMCPSGFSVSQCFNILSKMWFAYKKSLYRKNIEQMEKYAKVIQKVQEDMGIPTTSFPHLGIYGDKFILNNKKGEQAIFEDHSAFKKRQQEYEEWQVENAKKIQDLLNRPDESKGEKLLVIADDVYPFKKTEYVDEESVPELLVRDESKDEKPLVRADERPFLDQDYSGNNEQSLLTIADDVYPFEKTDYDESVPELLEPDENKGEKLLVTADDTPFLNRNLPKRFRKNYPQNCGDLI